MDISQDISIVELPTPGGRQKMHHTMDKDTLILTSSNGETKQFDSALTAFWAMEELVAKGDTVSFSEKG